MITNVIDQVLQDGICEDELSIGIYGSSFDPITNVHLWTANTVANRKKLDLVIFEPCNSKLRPDNKKMKTEDEHRWNMLKLAVKGNDKFVLSDYELKLKSGRATTFETMNYYQSKFPKAKLHFIMGADLLVDIPEWRHGKELIENFNFIVMARDGIDMLRTISKNPILRNNDIDGKFNLIDKGLAMEISSTYIRDELAMGGEPRYLFPENCYNYVKQHGLYTDPVKNKSGIK